MFPKIFCYKAAAELKTHSVSLFMKANPQGELSVNDAMTTTDPSDSSSDLGFWVCLCINLCVCVCLSPSCSLQHCLSRTSPCMWQCLYPIPMPCTSQEGLWAARHWQQPRPLWVTVGCCPLHRPLCTGMWVQVEDPRGPPVQVSEQKPQLISQSGAQRMIQTTQSRFYLRLKPLCVHLCVIISSFSLFWWHKCFVCRMILQL